MIALLIILAYVANVFLNRWLNKIIYRRNGDFIVPWLWFIPIFSTGSLIIGVLRSVNVNKKSWFTGKYW